MNYRHAFHAGNHADVFKHLTLTRLIALMPTSTPTPGSACTICRATRPTGPVNTWKASRACGAKAICRR